jgi:uncharacterized protein YdaU (DUF1376 family)
MYWGDYWRDTTHLSDAEHVSYLRLISHYWQHGALPNDDARLARITGRSKAEWDEMKPMLQAFFKHSGSNAWHHERIEKELNRETRLREGFTERAKRAASARWNASGMLEASIKQSSSNALHNHNQNNNNNTLSNSEECLEQCFKHFWESYPRKIGQTPAKTAFREASEVEKPEAIIEKLKAYKFSTDPKFIPSPVNWLRDRRWQDDPAAIDPPKKLPERDLRNIPDGQLSVNDYWLKRKQLGK